ncbi:MAG TPA: YIP1 family protein [Vicinamibacterales bacterium]|nr:YIP1 family protein [Vicinamibacterales bacterium]
MCCRIRNLTPPSPDNLTLLARITGVLIRPRSTFAAVLPHPRVAGLLMILTAASFAATGGLLATDVGQVALVDQWERTALAFGQPVDDAKYAQMQDLSQYGVAYAALMSVIRVPVVTTAIAAVLYGVFTAIGRQARFGQVFAVTAYAGVILALRDVLAAPLNYLRESLTSPITLTQLFGMLDEASPLARFFALIDLFMLWWIVVMGIGLAVLFRMRVRRVAAGLIGVYICIAVLLAGAMAVLGGNS